MALNPITYTEKILSSFLRYQLTTYPFADERFNRQMRYLLSLETARETPLLKGPFVSLSRAFKPGAAVEQLVSEGILHPHMQNLIPYPAVYGHQEEAIRAVQNGRTTLISTGTGSGKSECFLYPIISRCLELRDQEDLAGIVAVLVYPMNALAEDQLGRLRELLAGSGISFGMYVGKTPQKEADVSGYRLPVGSSNKDYLEALKEAREQGEGVSIHPPEEVCSREIMRTPGRQPRILLTNVKQLEYLLTRQSDAELFDDARLDYLVFDETHTFTGAQGAEAACLVRRLRSFCGCDADRTVCVATSATIVDRDNPDAARDFASRFFGVDRAGVVTVNEVYEEQVWAPARTVPDAPRDLMDRLKEVLQAVDSGEEEVREAWKRLTGRDLPEGAWEEALHEELSGNELLFQTSELLTTPQALKDLLEELQDRINRPVSEEELILWLTLGAAAQKNGRHLVRPVVHAFLRGVPGAVVTFEDETDEPQLLLSAEEDESDDEDKLRLRVSTCTTCGQHYHEHSLADFSFDERAPGGGAMVGDAVFWEPREVGPGGMRVLLVDRLISAGDDEEEEDHRNLFPLHFCRGCGAAHQEERERCLACGRAGKSIPLLVVRQRSDRPGKLSRCVCCGAAGRMLAGRFREPIKPVRATNVADVHVLAQDMVEQAERKRLLVFADNRQDAAFQAGWMRDHARRFRIRALMARALVEQALSIGDLTFFLDRELEEDDGLSMALLPEVWAVAPKEAGGKVHREERRYLLRILVLREITMTQKQQIGLEPWGRLKVMYVGLEESGPFVQKWSGLLGLPPDALTGGIAAMLDQMRRRRHLLDRTGDIFSKFWGPGAREIENGYLPEMPGVPQGVKFARGELDDRNRVSQWFSSRGRTNMMELALKWGVEKEGVEDFLRELWEMLTSKEIGLLVPVTLRGSHDSALPNCQGTHQIDADKLMLAANRGAFRCKTCRRRTVRRTPGDQCLAFRCRGQLEYLPEDPDNYDLHLIDHNYTLLRPREHTAMVPHTEREEIEQIFKGRSDTINALVCTQTLELGVDIGALDAVLMRNVPPFAANYWQRAGRAGRRHRMAVDITYARPMSHDHAYFQEPVKMLAGRIDPPSFNLSNEIMIAKHVHATILTRLHQLGREGSGLSEADRSEIQDTLRTVIPSRIRDYLFDDAGQIRYAPLEVGGLHTIITKHRPVIAAAVEAVFQQGWPESDAEAVTPENLGHMVQNMTGELEAVIRRLYRRLTWATRQMARLDERRRRSGILQEEERAFFNRCERMVKKLKGVAKQKRSQGEGVDGMNTLGVLAAEGFLPGYGLDTGAVVGMAEVPRWVRGIRDFDLPRVPSVAVREYVPGNLIYANGQKFVPRRFIRETGEDREDAIPFEVNLDRKAVHEVAGAATGDPSSFVVQSIPICDVHLVHSSRILDEEENRFQMGVFVFGRELGQHNGGQAYQWGLRDLLLRKGVRLQLVNVGSTFAVKVHDRVGYPVCLRCGQSVSPLSSDRQRADFEEKHRESCGTRPGPVGFHADLVVDVLSLPGCEDQTEAYSMAEVIRFAAAEMLDMDLEDLQVLVLGRPDADEPDALLYDPMPGGSGLLDQICLRFGEIVEIGRRLASGCAGRCAASCIDCFQTYRNAFYHPYLDRHVMVERLEAWGGRLVVQHPIPPKQPGVKPGGKKQPVNVAERKLRQMLLAAGLPEGSWQEQHLLPRPLGSTTPDVTFRDPDEAERKICVYLDGLSEHIHGNPETADRDCQIRAELRAGGHDVIVITAVDLDDEKAMTKYLKKLARALIGRDAVSRVQGEAANWFQARTNEYEPEPDSGPRIAAEGPEIGDADLAACLEYATGDAAVLIKTVHAAGGPLPAVGFEMVGKAGRVVAEADMAWEDRKVAVLDPGQVEYKAPLEKAGWTVLTHPVAAEEILGQLGLERDPDPEPAA